MFNINDPKLIWVLPGAAGGNGTAGKPFGKIDNALKNAEPGSTIVLKKGIYNGNLTIDLSGTAPMPIRITGETETDAEIRNACWFFYDTSDIIVTHLVFRDAPHGAISLIGACERNRFADIKFHNCGTSKETACTFFAGGSGGNCNVVENCSFIHAEDESAVTSANASIGLMVTEGDEDGNKPLKHFIARRNRFVNYAYGILIGSRDSTSHEYGHIVEYNEIDNCSSEGILVKCGDTQIRGNLIRNCNRNSIAVQAGIGTIVEDNRVVDCRNGIRMSGPGHSVTNNCVIRCREHAVRVCGINGESNPAVNLLIENNTFIDCGTQSTIDDITVAGIRIDNGTTCIIRRNLVHGKGKPYQVVPSGQDSIVKKNGKSRHATEFVVADNISSGGCDQLNGFKATDVDFQKSGDDNFENGSGYGATGWMLRRETFAPDVDESEKDYVEASVLESDDGNLILPEDTDPGKLFDSFFAENDESPAENDEE